MDITPERIEQFNRNPLYETVGIRLERVAGGRAESRLTPPPRVCWPFPNQPHGGMLFTIIDTTMAWAVQSRLASGAGCTTIDLTIQYLPRPGKALSPAGPRPPTRPAAWPSCGPTSWTPAGA